MPTTSPSTTSFSDLLGHPCIPVRNKVRHYARRAKITRRVYPHPFLATLATLLDQAHVSLTIIQKLMGHSHIKTTAQCVGIVGKEMRAAVRRKTTRTRW